jgi:hypothetical protein
MDANLDASFSAPVQYALKQRNADDHDLCVQRYLTSPAVQFARAGPFLSATDPSIPCLSVLGAPHCPWATTLVAKAEAPPAVAPPPAMPHGSVIGAEPGDRHGCWL